MRTYVLASVLFLSLLCGSPAGYAQTTCALTLRTARTTYDEGRLQEIPGLLEGCLKSGFTRQEAVEAYKLLVLSYIYLEEPAKADDALLGLLRADPYFEINESVDAAEFIALYKTFRTWPVYRIGAKLGVNATTPHITSHVSAVEGASVSYTPVINFQSGLVFEIPITRTLTLNPELYFQNRSFYYDSDLDLGGDLENSSEGKESQNSLSLPLSLQYSFSKSKLNPYVSIGIAADYLLKSSITMNRLRVNANSIQERTFDVTASRRRINLNAIASAGIKLRLAGGYVVSELRFSYGILPINEAGDAFTIDDYLLFDNAYADNTMKLNSLSISVGYIYNVFSPKKLKPGK